MTTLETTEYLNVTVFFTNRLKIAELTEPAKKEHVEKLLGVRKGDRPIMSSQVQSAHCEASGQRL